MARGVFGKGGFCPGGFCPGVYVQGVFVWGVFVLIPFVTDNVPIVKVRPHEVCSFDPGNPSFHTLTDRELHYYSFMC